MTITKAIIGELEQAYRWSFPGDLKRYLLATYSEEPFPYEYSEQDLYTNIQNDIHSYESGKLDITVKRASERWNEERNYLQNLYVEKCSEVHDLEGYIAELESILSEHGMESSRMAKRYVLDEDLPY